MSGCTSTSETRARLARLFGASRAWLVRASREELLAALGVEDRQVVDVLADSPVSCRDLRALGRACRQEGRPLVVDDTACRLVGCAAVRLGAHLAWADLGEGLCGVAVSRDVEGALPGATGTLGSWESSEADEGLAASLLEVAERLWHAESDAAQVVASYLRCHPRVSELRYPGLRGDPSFEVAARTLQGGFGPCLSVRLDGGSAWQSLRCGATDPREQVMELERRLSSDDRHDARPE